MQSIFQIRRSFRSAALVACLSVIIALGILPGPSWAASLAPGASLHPQVLMAVPTGREKAAARMFDGKTEESIGNVTGDRGDQLLGRAKQAQSRILTAKEDVKDSLNLN